MDIKDILVFCIVDILVVTRIQFLSFIIFILVNFFFGSSRLLMKSEKGFGSLRSLVIMVGKNDWLVCRGFNISLVQLTLILTGGGGIWPPCYYQRMKLVHSSNASS